MGLLRTAVRERRRLVHVSLRARLYSSRTQQVSGPEYFRVGAFTRSGPCHMAVKCYRRGSEDNREYYWHQWSGLSILTKFNFLERHEDAESSFGVAESRQ